MGKNSIAQQESDIMHSHSLIQHKRNSQKGTYENEVTLKRCKNAIQTCLSA